MQKNGEQNACRSDKSARQAFFNIYKKRIILSRFDRFCPGKAQSRADGKENKPRQKRKIPSVKLGQPREPVR